MYKFKYALGKGKPFSLWIDSLFSEIKKVLISLSLLILLNIQRHLCQALELMLERRSSIWSPLKNDMTINWKCATRIMVRNVCFCFWQFNSCQTYSYVIKVLLQPHFLFVERLTRVYKPLIKSKKFNPLIFYFDNLYVHWTRILIVFA